MLAARDGAARLPNGYLAQLIERTGKSRAELIYRAQFAEAYPNEENLCKRVAQIYRVARTDPLTQARQGRRRQRASSRWRTRPNVNYLMH